MLLSVVIGGLDMFAVAAGHFNDEMIFDEYCNLDESKTIIHYGKNQ